MNGELKNNLSTMIFYHLPTSRALLCIGVGQGQHTLIDSSLLASELCGTCNLTHIIRLGHGHPGDCLHSLTIDHGGVSCPV